MKKVFTVIIMVLLIFIWLSSLIKPGKVWATPAQSATQCIANAIATRTAQAYPVNGVSTAGQADAIATATPGIANAVTTSTAEMSTANTVATSLALTAVANATATGTVAGSIMTATAIKSGLNQGATATVVACTASYISTTQTVDSVFKVEETKVATTWAAGIASVVAQAISNCNSCDAIASYTATLTPTPSFTPTMPINNGVYFQSTPASGMRKITFKSGNVQDVYIDSIGSTPCSVDFSDGNTYTVFRHVYLADISKPIHFYGRSVTALYIDYGLNTGTATVIMGTSGSVVSQSTPGSGVKAVATKVRVDKIVIDSLVNTDCVIKIADGATELQKISITALPAVISMYGRYFTALNIDYNTKTGTAYMVLGAGSQNVIYQATPQPGTYSVPTPTVLENRKIDRITVDYLFGLPCQVSVYNGTVLYKTENIYSTPWDIMLGGASLSGMIIDYGLSTGTAKIICR